MGKTIWVLAAWAFALSVAAEESAAPTSADESPPAADIPSPGVYRLGAWEYIYRCSNPGSKSEGWHGDLFYEGLRVPAPENVNDYHYTPWGPLYWAGQRPVAFGSHGWMPKHLPSKPVGKKLPLPQADDGGPVVWIMRLREDKVPQTDEGYRGWAEEMAKRLSAGQEVAEIFRARLSYHEICVHDSKHHGRLTARLSYPRDRENLMIILDGAEPSKVTISRRDGAIGFACPTLRSHFGELRFALFFRVERAAANAPLPVWVGAESDGKTIEIRDTSRVVLSLPLTDNRAAQWSLANLAGDALRWAGEACATPNFENISQAGTAEISFLVVRKGTSTVTLHLSTGGAEKPALRTFKATFNVPDEPLPLPGEQNTNSLLP